MSRRIREGVIVAATLALGNATLAVTPADHIAIVNVVNEIGLSADLGDWPRARAQFAEQVLVDYTSLAGGQPATMKADDLIASWKGLLPGFTSTQHVITNHRVSVKGREATVVSQFIATHRLAGAVGGELWTLGGRYLHTLQRGAEGWKVAAMTMTWTWQSGNAELPKLAGEALRARGNKP